jgi:Ni/Co efflux regulator RcnB
MRTQRIVAAVAAASLLLSSGGVFAQAERNQELLDQAQRDAQRGYPRGDPRSGDARTPATRNQIRQAQAEQRRGDDRRGDYRGQPGYRNDGGYRADQWRHDGRGAGPSHSFYKGGRLPSQYRGRQYVVDDWRGHHLYAPPRGYQWVQTGGDYVLVAVATGIIAALLLNQ